MSKTVNIDGIFFDKFVITDLINSSLEMLIMDYWQDNLEGFKEVLRRRNLQVLLDTTQLRKLTPREFIKQTNQGALHLSTIFHKLNLPIILGDTDGNRLTTTILRETQTLPIKGYTLFDIISKTIDSTRYTIRIDPVTKLKFIAETLMKQSSTKLHWTEYYGIGRYTDSFGKYINEAPRLVITKEGKQVIMVYADEIKVRDLLLLSPYRSQSDIPQLKKEFIDLIKYMRAPFIATLYSDEPNIIFDSIGFNKSQEFRDNYQKTLGVKIERFIFKKVYYIVVDYGKDEKDVYVADDFSPVQDEELREAILAKYSIIVSAKSLG